MPIYNMILAIVMRINRRTMFPNLKLYKIYLNRGADRNSMQV